MNVRDKNLLFNSTFDIAAEAGEFPLGWIRVNGDDGTTWEWSSEFPVYGQHTVKIANQSYTQGLLGITQEQRYCVEVHPGEVYEISGWMKTEREGVPLRLIPVFMTANLRYHSEVHLKFTSSTAMQRYGGIAVVPDGAYRAKVACGVHDSPATLPSVLWISWVNLRRLR